MSLSPFPRKTYKIFIPMMEKNLRSSNFLHRTERNMNWKCEGKPGRVSYRRGRPKADRRRMSTGNRHFPAMVLCTTISIPFQTFSTKLPFQNGYVLVDATPLCFYSWHRRTGRHKKKNSESKIITLLSEHVRSVSFSKTPGWMSLENWENEKA